MLTYEERLDRDRKWALLEGSMHFEKHSAVYATLERLTERLTELGVDYAIAGGMAMFLHGFRRFTEDVDVLVTREVLDQVHAALTGRGYLRPFEASKNLRDTRTGVRIDFLVSGQFPGDGKPGPISFPVPSEASVERDGISVLDIRSLIELKLASGRSPGRRKDLGDVQELIRMLRLEREIGTRLDNSVRDMYFELWDELQQAAPD